MAEPTDETRDEVRPDAGEAIDPESMTEEEMVEAAKRAGEQAAAEELAAERDAQADEARDLRLQVAKLEEDLEAARAEAQAASDRMLRLQADWDNFRRRTAEERLAEKARAAEGLVSNLLPVVDDLERAVGHASQAAEGDEVASQLASGVDAVLQKLVGVLAREGAEVIDPAGEPFEPLDHQAVGRVEDAEAYEETVRDVYQRGWRMGGKVIRPAMVTVTFGGPKRPAPEPEPEREAAGEAAAGDGDGSSGGAWRPGPSRAPSDGRETREEATASWRREGTTTRCSAWAETPPRTRSSGPSASSP